jgi:hypothetical protein
VSGRHVDACGLLFRMTGEGCCVSCSEDAGMGEQICEIESPGKTTWAPGRFWASVCCVHSRMEPEDNENRRTWWAVLLRARRAARSSRGGAGEG